MKDPTPSPGEGPDRGRSRLLRGARLARFRKALLTWYRAHRRPLRIRSTRDPWAILVSEVMAQQTQISRVDDAWGTFMARFPSPRSLADAPTADVLRAWSGLGYNRRALNLQRAAAAIEAEHGGLVPADVDALVRLPGVGPYTARAVAAIAYGRPVAAVDTNVRRVLGRVLGVDLGPAVLQAEADAWVDRRDPATWTHASMELGAIVCLARRPRCDACPLTRWCVSARRTESMPRAAVVEGLPFERTNRWLRGRIVDRLRVLDEGAWERLPASIGQHDREAVRAAVRDLERDGLLERRPDGAVRLPSG